MVFFSRRDRSMLALTLVLAAAVLVYGGTFALTSAANPEPDECNLTALTIEDICYNPEKQAFFGNQPTVDVTIGNQKTDINGFRINLFGAIKVEPVIMFRTVEKGAVQVISAPYDHDIMGKLTRIEVEPILNLNRQVHYCNIRHGAVFEGEIKIC